MQDIQAALNQKGFNAGPADGLFGARTKAAISSAQRVLGQSVNGLPSQELVAAVNSMSVSGRVPKGEVIARVSDVFKGGKRFELEFYGSYGSPYVRVGDLVFIKSAEVIAKINKIEGKFAFADVIQGYPSLITKWQVVRKN